MKLQRFEVSRELPGVGYGALPLFCVRTRSEGVRILAAWVSDWKFGARFWSSLLRD